MLIVLDEFTRQALCVAVNTRMGSAEVLEELYPLILKHGKPEYLRSDYGPEFIAAVDLRPNFHPLLRIVHLFVFDLMRPVFARPFSWHIRWA